MPLIEKLVTELPAVAAIVIVVILFLKALSKSTDKFMELITNHLNDHKQALDKNTNVLGQVEDFIKEVLILLRRRNGKK